MVVAFLDGKNNLGIKDEVSDHTILFAESLNSYLSGLLIGTEVAHATMAHDRSAEYQILGTAGLAEAYVTAMKFAGLKVTTGDPLCVISGQREIAHAAGVI